MPLYGSHYHTDRLVDMQPLQWVARFFVAGGIERVCKVGILKGMAKRHELTDEEWERLRPLLPAQKPATGRPAQDHRQVVNGILWVLRTGAPWRDLPERYGKWTTIYSRLQRWRNQGVWERIWQQLQQQAAAEGQIEWEIQFLDGTIVRAHQHAAGAKKAGQKPKRSDVVTAD
jgi:transposase